MEKHEPPKTTRGLLFSPQPNNDVKRLLANMANDEYTAANLVNYEITRPSQTWCGLGQLNLIDKDFERRLKSNGLLRRCYKKIMTHDQENPPFDDDDPIHDDTLHLAKEFIEFGLMNRARLACEQKIELARHRHHLKHQSTKSQVVTEVDSELEYSHAVLSSFDSSEASQLKGTIQICLQSRLEDYQDSDTESVDDWMAAGHPEQGDADDGVHMIPDSP